MARHQQSYDNSCGASALLCAAFELGVSYLPSAGKWSFMENGTSLVGNTAGVSKALLNWNGNPLSTTEFLSKETESALYAITSGDLKSYSMPSRVIACAKHLGLNVTMYANAGFYKSVLNFLYSEQMQACQAQGIQVIEQKSPGPVGNQRELIVFSTFFIGLHYVMRRPATNQFAYMDPGDGQDYMDFNALNTWIKNYKATGISLILSASGG